MPAKTFLLSLPDAAAAPSAPAAFSPELKGNQGDLLTTLLACAGVPLDRPIGIATRQIKEMMA